MIVFAVILVVVVMRCVVEYVVCVVVTCYVGCCVADGVVVHVQRFNYTNMKDNEYNDWRQQCRIVCQFTCIYMFFVFTHSNIPITSCRTPGYVIVNIMCGCMKLNEQ